MRISGCVFFCATQAINYGHGIRIFQGFKMRFFAGGVTRLLGVVVVLLAFKTFNLGSVLTKIKTLNFYTNIVNFF